MANKYVKELFNDDTIREAITIVMAQAANNLYNSALDLLNMHNAPVLMRKKVRRALINELLQIPIVEIKRDIPDVKNNVVEMKCEKGS